MKLIIAVVLATLLDVMTAISLYAFVKARKAYFESEDDGERIWSYKLSGIVAITFTVATVLWYLILIGRISK